MRSETPSAIFDGYTKEEVKTKLEKLCKYLDEIVEKAGGSP